MPGYPVLPIIAGGLSVYFVVMLPKTTKIMVIIWMIIGLLIYLIYGLSHSKLQKKGV